MADNRNHDLFKTYPIAGRMRTSGALLPTPYHVYDGNQSFIAGTVSLEAVTNLLQSEHVYPLKTRKDRALMGMWIGEFTDASLGPHNQLQISFFVSEQDLPPVPNNSLILLRELLLNPQIRMIVHGLWNNTDTAIAYNNEILGLGARPNRGGAEYRSNTMNFLFNDTQGSLIASGRTKIVSSTPFGVSSSLLQLLGIQGMGRFNNQDFMTTQVMSRVSTKFPTNDIAQTYTAASKLVVQLFNKETDEILINQQPYGSLDFRPKFVQHMLGLKFVALNPYNRVDVSL